MTPLDNDPSRQSTFASPSREREAGIAVVRRLRLHGHQALFAGGCVRDLLMGHPPADYDVATSATPDEVLSLFRRTRAVGRQFGVVLVSERRVWIEVATFRSDASYTDGRRPDAITFSSPRDDAERRDFTINGMFLDPDTSEVMDFVGGRDDIAHGIVRAIGDPPRRFAEDHLRLLRAVRFAARFGYAIEPTTWQALRANAHLLPRVSPERIREELERMLCPPTRAAAWDMLNDGGLIAYLWPGSEDVVRRKAEIGRLFLALPQTAAFELIIAVLAMDDPAMARHICEKLHAPNAVRNAATWLAERHADLNDPAALTKAALKRLMARPMFAELLALQRAKIAIGLAGQSAAATLERRVAAVPVEDVAPPPLLTGDALVELGIPQGPRYARILSAVYDAQLNGEIHDVAAARALALRLAHE